MNGYEFSTVQALSIAGSTFAFGFVSAGSGHCFTLAAHPVRSDRSIRKIDHERPPGLAFFTFAAVISALAAWEHPSILAWLAALHNAILAGLYARRKPAEKYDRRGCGWGCWRLSCRWLLLTRKRFHFPLIITGILGYALVIWSLLALGTALALRRLTGVWSSVDPIVWCATRCTWASWSCACAGFSFSPALPGSRFVRRSGSDPGPARHCGKSASSPVIQRMPSRCLTA